MNESQSTGFSVDVSTAYRQVPRGWHQYLILDPERGEHGSVYSEPGPDNSWPISVHNRLALRLRAPVEATEEGLEVWIENNRDTIQSILDGYLGQKWDGHNHVGTWKEEAWETYQYLDIEDIQTYCSAEAYLSGLSESALLEELADSKSLAEYADACMANSEYPLDADDLIEYVGAIAEKALREGDLDENTASKLRAVLAAGGSLASQNLIRFEARVFDTPTALEDFAKSLGAEISQDWEAGTTTVLFSDGSKLVNEGPDWSVTT